MQDYLAAFGNAELVFCYTITSNLSGSYNAARLAKIDYEAQHPGRKVIVVDTLSAGPEIRMQMEQLARWLDAGEDPLTLEGKISDYGAHTGLMFSLESLQNLANNGRVSPLVAKLAGVPARVIERAREILEELESGEHAHVPARPAPAEEQMGFADLGAAQVAETLRKTALETLTPIEAMNLLYQLKQQL